MNPTEIKELIANGRTEKAVQAVKELTENTELSDQAIGIARRQRTFKKNSISGILDVNEINKEEAVITHMLMQLLNEYGILQVKEIHTDLGQLSKKLEEITDDSDATETLAEIKSLSAKVDEFDYADASGEQKKERLGKVGTFLNQLADPNSKAGKAIAMVKNGFDIAQDIAASYNSVAEWVGLPVVPRLFLKKLD